MKNKFAIILKNSLINTYKLKSMTKRKMLLILLLVVYVFSSIFVIFNDFFGNIYTMLNSINLNMYYLTIIFIV